jgi:hypothetical protein
MLTSRERWHMYMAKIRMVSRHRPIPSALLMKSSVSRPLSFHSRPPSGVLSVRHTITVTCRDTTPRPPGQAPDVPRPVP